MKLLALELQEIEAMKEELIQSHGDTQKLTAVDQKLINHIRCFLYFSFSIFPVSDSSNQINNIGLCLSHSSAHIFS